jgi:glutamyl/glutaminyl-tRNA synthetase
MSIGPQAFVCHQTKEEMNKSKEAARSRVGDPNSPWRNRPVEESLREFQRMRMGMYERGEPGGAVRVSRPCVTLSMVWCDCGVRRHAPSTTLAWRVVSCPCNDVTMACDVVHPQFT